VNVTVSLPEELLREARHEAVDHGLALSRYLAELLQERLQAGATGRPRASSGHS
jgi:hypothetical protein